MKTKSEWIEWLRQEEFRLAHQTGGMINADAITGMFIEAIQADALEAAARAVETMPTQGAASQAAALSGVQSQEAIRRAMMAGGSDLSRVAAAVRGLKPPAPARSR